MEPDASKRLFWTLNGPRESSIQVVPSRYHEPEALMEPYYHPAAEVWHPVSQESLYTPAQQTTAVKIDNFWDYEELWFDKNWEDSGAFWAALERDDPDFDPGDRDPDYYGIPICPIHVDDCRLRVTTAGEYLTIREDVSVVHPWLMSIRKTLLEALKYTDTNDSTVTWRSESKLVLAKVAGMLRVGGESESSTIRSLGCTFPS
jgi:hypothetical protein